MPKKRNIALIIDANSLMHRSFHALPPFSTKDGTVVNAVYGFVSTLLKAIKDFSPTHIVAAFDMPGGTFRHKEYPEYKANREKAPQELYDQFPIVQDVLNAMNISVVEKEQYEADDIIGTIVSKKDNLDYVIATADMDSMQLVNSHTKVFRLRKGVTDFSLFDEKGVKEMYGLTPEQIIDYKGLRGDPSDNIPGVKGIGEKTATDLLQTFGTLEKVIDEAKKNNPKIKTGVREKLLQFEKDAYLSKKLATIVTDAPIAFNAKEAEWSSYDAEAVRKIFQKLEFKSLLDRIPGAKAQKKQDEDATPAATHAQKHDGKYHCLISEKDFSEFLTILKKQKQFTFDTETTGTNPHADDLLGISFSFKKNEAYYLPVVKHKKWIEQLQPIFEDEKVKKFGHNIKFDYAMLRSVGVTVAPLSFDTMVAMYLIRPGLRQYNLDSIAFKELGHRMQPLEELIGKGKKQIPVQDVPLEEMSWYSCEDADFTNQLVEVLDAQLKENNLQKLFDEIEMPLVSVLAAMEEAGVAIDVPYLKNMEKDMAKKIDSLTKNIYRESGEEFNINSPLQMKKILFETLKLSTEGLSKTKTGISTAVSELEKLQGLHPIVDFIMEYRELSKLQSTYVSALPELISKKTKRLHTSYNQTVAVTGRLSSSNPNLQNIPIRTELGNDIRKAFIAREGNTLISADYSQVELRIIASLSHDEKMIESFKKGEDIHKRTASYIFDVELEEVTDEMRRAAKEVNFGVLYGMGAYGLASRKKISREKAQAFIEKYFTVYDAVYQYLEDTRTKAREDGYVETLMGRKRYLPDIYSSMRQVRAAAERMAVNLPVQGTAADIMKMAMIEIQKGLPAISKTSRMTMQVHDELVFEVPKSDVNKVAEFAKKKMEAVAKMDVPLLVDVSVGQNWRDMEKIL